MSVTGLMPGAKPVEPWPNDTGQIANANTQSKTRALIILIDYGPDDNRIMVVLECNPIPLDLPVFSSCHAEWHTARQISILEGRLKWLE
jgi:hypothetical protein